MAWEKGFFYEMAFMKQKGETSTRDSDLASAQRGRHRDTKWALSLVSVCGLVCVGQRTRMKTLLYF